MSEALSEKLGLKKVNEKQNLPRLLSGGELNQAETVRGSVMWGGRGVMGGTFRLTCCFSDEEAAVTWTADKCISKSSAGS